MRQGPEVCGGLEICACTRRTNTGGICRQLCEAGGGGAAAEDRGVGVWSWMVVLGGGEGREEGRGGGWTCRVNTISPLFS